MLGSQSCSTAPLLLGSAPHQGFGELGWSTFLPGAERPEEGLRSGRAQGVPTSPLRALQLRHKEEYLCVSSLGCRWEGLGSPGSLGSEMDSCEHRSEVRSEKPPSPHQHIFSPDPLVA